MREGVEISVMVLTYNQAESIGRTLESILAQKLCVSYEIVVSDDCSSDTTRAIVENFRERYPELIRLLPSTRRRGLVENYFYTLSLCRGRFIADCAGDDYWLDEDGLRRKYEILRDNPSVTMVFSDWLIFNEGSSELRKAEPDTTIENGIMDGKTLIEKMIACCRGPMIHLSTALYRRSVIDEALSVRRSMVDNPEFGSEDMPVILALLAAGKVVKTLGNTLAYCLSSDSVSSPADDSRRAVYFLKSACMVARLADYYGVSRRNIRDVLRDKIEYAFVCAYQSRRLDLCRQIDAERRQLHVRTGVKYIIRLMLSRIFCR